MTHQTVSTLEEASEVLLADATHAGVIAWRHELVWRLAQEVRSNGPEGVSNEVLTKITIATLWLSNHPKEET